MKLETDFTQLTDKYPGVVKHDAWPEFVKTLENRAIGGEALVDAWSYFTDGWDARRNRAVHTEQAVPVEIASEIGLLSKALGVHFSVVPSSFGNFEIRFVAETPRFVVDRSLSLTEFRHLHYSGALRAALHYRLTEMQRELFRGVAEHMAKYDRSPVERLHQIEEAAKTLLDIIGTDHVPTYCSSPLSRAVQKLDHLLKAKTGAADWSDTGYGEDD